jgi:hypothetical protein
MICKSSSSRVRSKLTSSSKNLYLVSGNIPSGPEIYEHEVTHIINKKEQKD